MQKIDGMCFDGVRNGRENPVIPSTFDAGGTCPRRRGCTGTLYGDVCVMNVSGNCVGGSAAAYCAGVAESRVITQAEFIRAIAAGWVRPNANYHTMSVEGLAQCAGGQGSVDVPGYGAPQTLYQCGDNLGYCNRAIMCVLR